MLIEQTRYSITLKASFLIFSITLLATIIRPILIDQDNLFTYIGVFNALALGAVFSYIKWSPPKPWYPFLLCIVGIVVLTPITLVSGGVNSQFAFLFPIIPMFMALVSSPKYTWLVTACLIGVILGLFLGGDLLPDFTFEEVPQSKSAARALWLCFSVLLSAKFGIEFNRINSALGSKLSHQAEIDALTGIANRRSVMNALQTAIDESKAAKTSLSVMMIDLDHFKSINDSFGHLVGDHCLKTAALTIQQCVRNNRDLAGRYGGEEFIAIVRDVDAQKAVCIANKIRTAIEQASVKLEGLKSIKLTATVGICSAENGKIPSIEKVLESADQALYKGKQEGRNCVVINKAD